MKREPDDETLDLHDEKPVRLPAKWLATFGALIAAGAIAWATTSRGVDNNTRRIDALEADARLTRELLIRIDENVKTLKERK